MKMNTAGSVSRYAGVQTGGFFDFTPGPTNSALMSAIGPIALTADSSGNLYIATSTHVLKVSATTGAISIFAGSGSYGFSGDGAPAASASFAGVSGMAFDNAGNLFVSDSGNHRVRKIAAGTGIVTTVAGNGTADYAGDGQAATSASLHNPDGLAFDPAGNLYIADSGNSRIRKVSQGIITTYAGNGSTTASGDGGPSELAGFPYVSSVTSDNFGNLYVPSSYTVRKIEAGTRTTSTIAGSSITYGFAGDGGNAALASFTDIDSVISDMQGNLYLADTGNLRIRKISQSGIVATVVGNGTYDLVPDNTPALSAPVVSVTSPVTDASGNLYFTDGFVIQKLSIASGTLSTYAGTGQYSYDDPNGHIAATVALNNVRGLAFGPGNTLYFSDYPGAVRKIDPTSGIISTIANAAGIYGYSGDGGAASAAAFEFPGGLAFDASGNIYVADTNNCRIRKITATTGIITTVAGNGICSMAGDNGPAVSASLTYPQAISVDGAGNIYVVDSSYVRKISATTGVITTFAGSSSNSYYTGPADPLSVSISPFGLSIDSHDSLYIAEGNGGYVDKVQGGLFSRIAGGGAWFTGNGGPPLGAGMAPNGIAVDRMGRVFITDNVFPVWMISTPANQSTVSTNPPGVGITVDGTTYSSSASFAWTVGSTHTIAAGNVVYGNNVRYAFTSWSDGGALSHTVTAQPSGATYTANYSANYTVNWSAAPSKAGTVSFSPSSSIGYYGAGTLQLTATAYTGYKFTSFSGDVSSTSNPYSFNLTGPVNITANFSCNPSLSATSSSLVAAVGGGASVVLTDGSGCAYSVASGATWITVTSPVTGTGSGTITMTVAANTGAARSATVSIAGLTYTVNQAGAAVAATSKVGVVQAGNWYIDADGNGQWDGPPSDKQFTFAAGAGDIAVTGDWNGDGRIKAGVYHNGFWLLDYNGNGVWDGVGVDRFIALGGNGAGEVPVVGDWNGSGTTKVGVYYKGFWLLDYNGNGQWDGTSGGDRFIALGGGAGETPVTGDWNGDGRVKVGIFLNGTWSLDYNGNGVWDAADKTYSFSAGAGDVPVVGDWTGTHTAKIGVYHAGFWLLDLNGNGQWDGTATDKFIALGGNPGETPVVGDWNGSGTTKVGFYYKGFWALDYNGNGQWDGVAGGDRFVALGGAAGEQPIVAKW